MVSREAWGAEKLPQSRMGLSNLHEFVNGTVVDFELSEETAAQTPLVHEVKQ